MRMDIKFYQRKRDFIVCGVVGVCATTREDFVREAFSMPTTPVSATIDLVGVPAIISAKENPKYAEIYNKSTMAAIDGMPIVKIGLKKGIQCERCAAPDIMGLMFEESVRQGKTHYFYGGKNDEVLEKLKGNLEIEFPGIQIVGMYSPPFRPLTDEEDKRICGEINELKPDFLWVGIGAPKQEMWMWQHQEKIQGTVMIGVGAGFDFLAGTLEKAPVWMENASLEWLFRLIKEPKRLWKRYIIGGVKFAYYSIEDVIVNLK
jgi:N-acetylglucosaminyldiphosphoundecaprenol N-acetyl-beta-D-mannosaminyltransferase